jgi:hypothetical protein
MKMEAAGSSQPLVTTYMITLCHNPEEMLIYVRMQALLYMELILYIVNLYNVKI